MGFLLKKIITDKKEFDEYINLLETDVETELKKYK